MKIDLSNFLHFCEESEEFFENNQFDIIESVITPKIQDALDRGETLTGISGAPYAKSYVPIRQRYGKQVSYRDLNVKGSLRGSIGLRDKTKTTAWITVSDEQQDIALGHVSGQLGKNSVTPFPFFEVDENTEKESAVRVGQEYQQFIHSRGY